MTQIRTSPPPTVWLWLKKSRTSVQITDLVSLDTSRTMENPVASATITFKGDRWGASAPLPLRGRRFEDTIDFYDLVRIDWHDRQALPKRWPVLVGFVIACEAQDGMQEALPSTEFVLTVRSLGEALVRYQIFWHPHIAAQNNLGGIGYLLRAKGKLPTGRPDQVIQTLFSAFLNGDYLFTLADGRKIYEAVTLSLEAIPDGAALTALSAMGMEGALWATLKRYADCPWNEFFMDVPLSELSLNPGHASTTREEVVLRPTPWTFERWDRLATSDGWLFTFPLGERIGPGLSLRRSADSVYNFFWCTGKAEFSGFDQLSILYNRSGGKIPRYDADAAERYGLRRLEVSTEYVQFRTEDDATSGAISAAHRSTMNTGKNFLCELLENRTTFLHQTSGFDGFWEGSYTTVGRVGLDGGVGARIGGIARFSDGREGYITGVRHAWGVDALWMTTLTLTKVHKPSDWRGWWKRVEDARVAATPRLVSLGIGRL